MSREYSPPDRDVLVALNRAATAARLMSGVVHEVNNALQVIGGSVELLDHQPSLPATVVKSLERIGRQTERAAATLAELLAFTKAPLDGAERFNVRESVSRAIALRHYAVTRLGLTIDMRADEHASYIAVGNAGYIQQAVLNLLVNAEQAMTGRHDAIVVTLRGEPDRVGVEVTDAGPGLTDAARASLFEAFSSTKEPREGSGLGLWAARAIVESFDGSLDLTSGPTGTTAVLWLPRG